MKKSFLICLCLLVSSCKFNNDKEAETKKWTASSPLEELGHHLYFEKRFSHDNSISCNSCHNVTQGGSGTDNLATSTGINGQKGGRNAPTVLNAKFISTQFWDGRAKDLAEQAKGPITNPIEMGMKSHDDAIAKIKDDGKYKELFAKAFPGQADSINIENVSQAISAFESTLVTLNSPYDKKEMSPTAQKGFEKFQSTGCIACHSGPHFAGPEMSVGSGFFMKFPTFPNGELESKYGFSQDPGRFEVTQAESDRNMWRVPSLRNVARTAPYFHNGKVNDLKEAVVIMAKTQLNKDLSDQDASEIVEFLKSLSGTYPEIVDPTL